MSKYSESNSAGTGPLVEWEDRFPPKEHVDDPSRDWPSTDVAYVVPFMWCPEAVDVPKVDPQHDAKVAFADSAAVMKHIIHACAQDVSAGHTYRALSADNADHADQPSPSSSASP